MIRLDLLYACCFQANLRVRLWTIEILNIWMSCVKVSALVTGEFYTKKEHFPGFARPFVFNAEVLLRFVGNFSNPSPFILILTGLLKFSFAF